jgi:tRNA(fMet)-specific endonuclease VapC
MSLYVLDTDSVTLLQRKHPILRRRFLATAPADRGITIITVEEQLTGWYTRIRRVRRPDQIAHAYESLTRAVEFFGTLKILSFTEPAVHRYSHLSKLKLHVGGMDLRIAAIALEHGAVVVSRNLRDFQRVPGLAVEDWSV